MSNRTRRALLVLISAKIMLLCALMYQIAYSDAPFATAEARYEAAERNGDPDNMKAALRDECKAMGASLFGSAETCD